MPKMAKTCQKVPKGAKKGKRVQQQKNAWKYNLIFVERKYMLKSVKTATNCPKLQDQIMSKSAKKCYNMHHKKLPKRTKRCQKASYISLYETTMSSTCHIFGKIDYNSGSPV